MSRVLSRDAMALHLTVLAIVIIADLIGVIRVPIGIATIILLPILYAFAIGIALNPSICRPMSRILTPLSLIHI